MIQRKTDGQYVSGWVADNVTFEFSEHKYFAQVFRTYDSARNSIVRSGLPLGQFEYQDSGLTPYDKAVGAMMELDDEQRVNVFRLFCRECGNDNPRCQCWNDE